MAPPLNVLLIVTDQHRWDASSACGNALCPTPNLERLAAEGVRFSNAFACTALCGPGRASLYTGLLPHHHGVMGNSEKHSRQGSPADIAPGVAGMAEFMRGLPHIRYLLGKWHVEETRVPSDFGFRGHDFKGYAHPGVKVWRDFRFNLAPETGNPYADWLRRKGIEPPRVSHAFQGNNPGCQDQELYGLLEGPEQASIPWFLMEETLRCMAEARSEGRPFFAWVNFWGPHSPSVVPEPWFSAVDPASIPEDPAFRETFEGKPEIQRTLSRMWGLYDAGWETWREIVARYYGYVMQIDAMVGRLLAELERTGELERTVVIFTADHGDAMGAHRLIEKGEFMYDQTYRVPLIARHPQGPRGAVCDAFVYFHDLCPTIVELAGGRTPDNLDSRSLAPLMTGAADTLGREFVYGQFTRHFVQFNQRMIRTRDRKLIWNTASVSELYDLERDPAELANRIGDAAYAADKRRLLGLLEEEMARVGDPLMGWFRRVKAVV